MGLAAPLAAGHDWRCDRRRIAAPDRGGEACVERTGRYADAAQIVLAVLGVVAALYLLKPILVPIALALLLASMLSPVTGLVRRILPVSATGAALLLFIVTVLLGLYVASLTAQSLIEAAESLPGDVEPLAGRLSERVSD